MDGKGWSQEVAENVRIHRQIRHTLTSSIQMARKGDAGKYPGTNWHTGGHMYACIHTHLAHRPYRGQDSGRHTQHSPLI